MVYQKKIEADNVLNDLRKMENSLLKVGINPRDSTIQILDRRTQKLWLGNFLAFLTYWDSYEYSVSLGLTEDAGWQIVSKEEKNEMKITYIHPKLELSLDIIIEIANDVVKVTVPASKIKEEKFISWANGNPNRLEKISLLPQFGAAKQGEKGYIVLPQQSGVICEFNNKISSEYEIGIYQKTCEGCIMPIFGFKNDNSGFLGIITGGKYDASLSLGTNKGKEHLYYLHPSFNLRYYYDEERLPDDISVEYHFLTDNEASYVGMAKRYRSYVLKNGKVIPLKERIKNNSVLDYAARSLEVRVRCGWKPCPPEILEQTPENEPEMKVACTFDKAGEIVDEFKMQGIDKAEFCLVGWNCKGHDGRYPQIFPVEEKLGGEEKLRKLIRKAQDMGYQIAAHDCYHEAYRISEDWDEEYLLKTHDGELFKYGKWSGGQSYLMCPRQAYELFASRDLPHIKELGFSGLHYTDVLSIVGPQVCYDLKHPLKRKGYIEWRNKILRLAQKTFGGVQSEGPFDFAADSLDRVLYVNAHIGILQKRDYVDKIVPLYEVVYHGILLYTVSLDAINSLKGDESFLKTVEYGGIPLVYFYAHFTSEYNALGRRDFRYEDRESLKKDVARIKEVYDELKKLSYLQTEFIEDHQMLKEDVYKTIYSDGTRIIVNYSGEVYTEGEYSIQPYSYLLIKQEKT